MATKLNLPTKTVQAPSTKQKSSGQLGISQENLTETKNKMTHLHVEALPPIGVGAGIIFLEQSFLQKKKEYSNWTPGSPGPPRVPREPWVPSTQSALAFSNREFSDEFLEQSSLQKKRVFKLDPWVPWTPPGSPGSPGCPAHSQHWLFRTENSQMNRVFFLEQSSLQKKRVFKLDPWVPWAPQGPQGALGAQPTVSTGFFEQRILR